MSRSKKVILLATFAVLSFPMTIAVVALDLRSLINRTQSEPAAEETKQSESNLDSPTNKTSSQLAAKDPNRPPEIEDEVISVLKTRVENLRTTMAQAKVEEVRIKTELQANQDLQVSTKRSLKATERAIEEIKSQSPEKDPAERPTLRSTQTSKARSQILSSQSAPSGWENYFGILGVGYGRPYRKDELAEPQAFMKNIDRLSDTLRTGEGATGSEQKFTRVVHISGLEGSDPGLESLRRIGRENGIEIKRVRHTLPGFESNYLMVQIFQDLGARRTTETSVASPPSALNR